MQKENKRETSSVPLIAPSAIIPSYVVSRVRASNIRLDKYRPRRVGIIPYIISEKGIIFAFGLDTHHKELTDFGGGLEKKDFTCIHGAVRECNEESLGAFDDIDVGSTLNSIALMDDSMIIFLVKTNITPESSCKKFFDYHEKLTQSEVCSICWVELNDLLSMINKSTSPMYKRVKSLLIRSGNFWELLK